MLANRLRSSPIIVALRDPEDLPKALESPHPVIFVLSADIASVVGLVGAVRGAGKEAFVHFDLVNGLGKDAHALRWLAETARPTGVITTKAGLISQAKSLGLVTVQRMFLVDSQSVQMAAEQARKAAPDFLEAMPGIAPEGIRLLAGQSNCPVIAGGLVRSVVQVKAALSAGAVAISTSSEKLWQHTFEG